MRTTTPPAAQRKAWAGLVTLALALGALVPTPATAAAPAAKPTLRITKVTTAQVSKTKTRTTVRVVLQAPKTARTTRIKVAVNPTGKASATGKTITRTVRAKWSKGAYRATVKVRTGGPGKVTVTHRVQGKTVKATRKSPGKLTTKKITGWDPSRTVKAGAKVTDTVKISPAWGRTVVLEQYTGGRWVTRQRVTTAKKKTAKVTFTLTAPTATGASATRWRVRVPATAHAKGKKTPTRVLTRQDTTRPPTPGPTPGPDDPTPDPERPGWPLWCGQDFRGNPIACYRPTISTVLDRFTYNPRCYHKQHCWRTFTEAEGGDDGTVFPWVSLDIWNLGDAGRVGWKPLAAPDWLKHLNTYRQERSAQDGIARHVLRPAPWSITVDGYTVPGQGGHAQMWAMEVGRRITDRPMEQGDHSDMFERLAWINERWPDARGYWWECGVENLSGSTTGGTSQKILWSWATSPGHRTGLLRAQSSYSSFGAALADNGTTVAVYQGCYLGLGEWNPSPAYEADGVTPAIWQPPAGWQSPTN